MNFIKTTNSETAQKLIEAGYPLLDMSNNVWTFINEGSNIKQFSKEDQKAVVYTDVLSI